MIEVELPDGTILEVPEGTSTEQINALLKKIQQRQPVAQTPTEPTPVSEPAQEVSQKPLSISDLSSPENMSIIKESFLLRQGGEGIASKARRGAEYLGGKTNMQLAGTETDQELIDKWLEQNRLLNVGQSVTLGNEVALVSGLSDQEKETLNKSYKLFDSLENVLTGDTTIGQKYEAVKDYVSGAIWDPTTPISFGVGKGLVGGSTKAATVALKVAVDESVKQATKTAAKQGLKGAVAKAFVKAEKDKALVAGMSVIRNNAAKKELLGGVATDFVLEVGKDVLYQNKVQMEVDPDREYSYSQTAVSALGAVALPAIVFGAKGVSKAASLASGKLAEKYNLKDIFDSYSNASLLADKMSPEEVKKEILSKLNVPNLNSSIKGSFDNFLADREALASWKVARDLANQDLRNKGITPTNTFEFDDFYRKLFAGSTDATNKPLGEGLLQALSRDGIAFKALDEDDKIANFLGDAITYLDPKVLRSVIRDYQAATGVDLGFNLRSSKLSKEVGDRWKTNSRIAGLTNQLNSLAKRTLGESYTLEDLAKLLNEGAKTTEKESDASYLAWGLSVRNRLMTAHPSTTAINLRGWAYMSGANTLSDIVEGSLNFTAGKLFNNNTLAVKGKGTLLGVARRGYNVLNWNDTVAEGVELLENIPKAKEDLFRIMSGDVGMKDPREFYKIGDNNKVVNAIETYTSTLQKIWGVNLQDQQTKLISFVSNFDQALMRNYDITLKEFMNNPKWQVELRTTKFVTTYEEALEKTLKETGSFSWSDKAGNTVALKAAKQIEKWSNSSSTGWLLPFGRWFNTSTAFASDFVGTSLLYNSVLKAGGIAGEALGKGDAWKKAGGTDLVSDMAKTSVFWGGIAMFSNEADEKVESGTPWNIKVHDDGTREDITNQFPRNVFSFFAQMTAHYRKDGVIPSELSRGGFETLFFSAFKGTGDTIQELQNLADDFYNGEFGNALSGFIGKVAASNFSVSTRGLDPVNNALLLFTDDFKNPDRRQGNKLLKEALRYVDQIGSPSSPARQDSTKGLRGNRDISKVFSGFSTKNEVAIADRLLAAVGQENWRVLKWQGDPVVKNRMDEIFSSVINEVARDKLAGYPDFFKKPLADQQVFVKDVIDSSKKITVSMFESGVEERDKGLILLRELNNFSDKRSLEKAKEILKVDDLADLLVEPGGNETLEKLLATAKVYGDRILD